MEVFNCKNQLIKIFLEFVSAVNPAKLVAENLKLFESNLQVCGKTYKLDDGKIYLVGFGKAVLGMASQTEKILRDRLVRGVICVPEDTQKTFQNHKEFSLKSNSVIEVFEGAKYNLPDEKAEKGAQAIIELVNSLNNKHDKLIVLISGGGSALFPKPKSGITLEEKLKTISCLASASGNIAELNTVRKKLSEVKGGGLAYFTYPVQTISLILSDVLNDPLDVIASGPTVPNSDDDNAAFEIIKKYNLIKKMPENVMKVIKESGSRKTVPSVNNTFPHVDNFLIGNNVIALIAAKRFAETCGFKCVILSSEINGLVQNVADFYENLLDKIINLIQNPNDDKTLLQLENLMKNCSFSFKNDFLVEVKNLVHTKFDSVKKICVIAGGETTVRVNGNGKGGRNQELALIMLTKIRELKLKNQQFFSNHEAMFLSAGSDGIDGPTGVAGAIIENRILDKAEKSNISINEYLRRNDSYNFFMKIDNGLYLIKTGHTGTNVADFHILAIYETHE